MLVQREIIRFAKPQILADLRKPCKREIDTFYDKQSRFIINSENFRTSSSFEEYYHLSYIWKSDQKCLGNREICA